MNKICLIPNMKKEKALEKTKELYNKFVNHGIKVYLTLECAKALGKEDCGVNMDVITKNVEMLLVLGGDGTLLKVARDFARHDIPILGINVGKVGFLTEIEIGEINGHIEAIINENYKVKERLMLEASVIRDDNQLCKFYALNDVVISKSPFSKLIKLNTHINGNHLETYPGDGLIVATSTGSTGYSLSAGGPVVNHDLKALIITPVCPHILNSRSVVISPEEKINITINSNNAPVALTVDGQQSFTLEENDKVEVKASDFNTKIVKFNKRSFYKVLKHKLVDRKA